MDNEVEASLGSPSASSKSKLQLPLNCDPPGPQNPAKQRVWIVFGATGHMGRSVVKAALAHSDLVTAVGRTLTDTLPAMHSLFAASPDSSTNMSSGPSPMLPLLCDVRIRSTVDAVLKKSLEHWGRIDIIVNCSGYGVIGACEDQDDYEIRNQFETNFWGTLNIIQLSLAYFRERTDADGDGGCGGRYLIFSSTSGSLGVPGLGPFCATKYAVEGLIESMLYETDAFNIRATLVEPGHVRDDEPLSPLEKSPPLPTYGHFFIKPASAPYASPTSPAGHAKRMVQWLGERQPTSAVKAAELVWQLGHCRYPPLRLLLGSFAVESVRDRLRCVTEEIEDWRFLSFKADGETDGVGARERRGSAKTEEGEGEEEEDVKMEGVEIVGGEADGEGEEG